MHCTNGGEGQAEGRGEGQMHCTSCVEDGGAEGGGRRGGGGGKCTVPAVWRVGELREGGGGGGANALYQLCRGWGAEGEGANALYQLFGKQGKQG